MGLPTISLVGRPNVGKSTLFNRLSHSRQALVSDFEGLTRDRQYARRFYLMKIATPLQRLLTQVV